MELSRERPQLSHADDRRSRDDQMVNQLNANWRSIPLQSCGKLNVAVAWLRIAGWMIVADYKLRTVEFNCPAKQGTKSERYFIPTAQRDHFLTNEPGTVIQVNRQKAFFARADHRANQVSREPWVTDFELGAPQIFAHGLDYELARTQKQFGDPPIAQFLLKQADRLREQPSNRAEFADHSIGNQCRSVWLDNCDQLRQDGLLSPDRRR